jgi:tripartite-type tricarboxylate transporter receptor subunit TctC
MFVRLVILSLAFLLCTAASAQPQTYPSKPIRIVVPYVAGGATDITARQLGEKLSQRVGQPVLIDNRGGAAGNIGMEFAAKSAPDGYTILLSAVGAFAVNPHLYKLNYDAIRDLAPIILISTSAGLLAVHPSVPAKNVKELVALAKARPGELNYGSSGVGGFGHVSAALFTMMTGTKMVHVPYKSSGPALIDLMAGHIQLLFNNAISTVPQIKAGRVRALAVTSIKRTRAVPDLPTLDEAGVKGYDQTAWSAIAAPAGTPKDIVARLNSEFNAILKLPDIQQKNAEVGSDIVGGTPEYFGDYLKSETAKFARIVKEAKITAE